MEPLRRSAGPGGGAPGDRVVLLSEDSGRGGGGRDASLTRGRGRSEYGAAPGGRADRPMGRGALRRNGPAGRGLCPAVPGPEPDPAACRSTAAGGLCPPDGGGAPSARPAGERSGPLSHAAGAGAAEDRPAGRKTVSGGAGGSAGPRAHALETQRPVAQVAGCPGGGRPLVRSGGLAVVGPAGPGL